ncbi:MAG: transcription elongation factor GreA [Hyphomicrobiales bacterium]|nr:transcription elongation factor GreA [Hyphomicrobiales bacterium]
MSRAFTREDDNESAINDLGERPVSPHRNLVTEQGLAKIDETIAGLQADMGTAQAETDRMRIAVLSRDLRYWASRRETAELAAPDADSDVVRFGMSVTIEDEDGKRRTWKVVGEDEADASTGSISHVSPMAQALFGKGVGDVATVGGKDWEIVGFG